MNLDSEKVISEIDNLVKKLRGALKKKQGFPDLHKTARRLAKVIFTHSADYKNTNGEYPDTTQLVITSPGRKEVTRIPNNENLWKEKEEFGKRIIDELLEGRNAFSLKLRLQRHKDSSIQKELQNLKRELGALKQKIK